MYARQNRMVVQNDRRHQKLTLLVIRAMHDATDRHAQLGTSVSRRRLQGPCRGKNGLLHVSQITLLSECFVCAVLRSACNHPLPT